MHYRLYQLNIFAHCYSPFLGTVRHFDLRTPHICSPHSVRSFLTSVRRPARQYPQPRDPNIREGCPSPLLDYGDYGIDINSLSLNKLQPQYFIIAGMDDFVYLHDRRMIGRGGRGAGKRTNWAATSRCVKRFTSGNDRRRRRNKHITACKFSDANSQEVSCRYAGFVTTCMTDILSSLLVAGHLMPCTFSTCMILLSRRLRLNEHFEHRAKCPNNGSATKNRLRTWMQLYVRSGKRIWIRAWISSIIYARLVKKMIQSKTCG